MGQLLSSLNLRGNSDIVPEIGFDIESKQKKRKINGSFIHSYLIIDAAPSPEELEIYNELHTLLIQPTSNLLQSFKQYEPASDAIRDAIATPSDDNEDKAWNAVLPTVNMLRTFYSYSSELGNKQSRLGCMNMIN